jgi:hypothetical protein
MQLILQQFDWQEGVRNETAMVEVGVSYSALALVSKAAVSLPHWDAM